MSAKTCTFPFSSISPLFCTLRNDFLQICIIACQACEDKMNFPLCKRSGLIGTVFLPSFIGSKGNPFTSSIVLASLSSFLLLFQAFRSGPIPSLHSTWTPLYRTTLIKPCQNIMGVGGVLLYSFLFILVFFNRKLPRKGVLRFGLNEIFSKQKKRVRFKVGV